MEEGPSAEREFNCRAKEEAFLGFPQQEGEKMCSKEEARVAKKNLVASPPPLASVFLLFSCLAPKSQEKKRGVQ